MIKMYKIELFTFLLVMIFIIGFALNNMFKILSSTSKNNRLKNDTILIYYIMINSK